MENSLFNVENYNKNIDINKNMIVEKYISIINEYLLHACDNIVIPNYTYYLFVLKRGISSIKHIFSTLFLYTKNLELTTHHCRKAYMYYVEFIGQIGDINHSYLQLNSKDAMLFIYKKTIFELNNEYRKTFSLTDEEVIVFDFINNSIQMYNDIILFIIDNDNLQNRDTRLSYIMYIQKMGEKILIKYLNADLSIGEKINICKIYTYYKNILAIKNITDECHFLNLSNMFFKKILKGKFVTEYTIKNKMYSSECNEKLNSFTPTKFTNWLFNVK